MKRYIYYIIGILLLAGLTTSCQKETPMDQRGATMCFTLNIPADEQTKAVGDVSAVTHLRYQVYEVIQDVVQTTPVISGCEKFEASAQTISVTLDLIYYQQYKIVFWADHADAQGNSLYYNTDNLQCVTFKDGAAINCNDTQREAYYAMVEVDNILDLSAEDTQITLIRPFAQLNILVPTTSAVTASAVTISSLATSFYPLTGRGGDAAQIIFKEKAVVEGATVTVSDIEYKLAAMCYAFVPGPEVEATSEVVCTMTMPESTTQSANIGNVPFKTNYRSNIIITNN